MKGGDLIIGGKRANKEREKEFLIDGGNDYYIVYEKKMMIWNKIILKILTHLLLYIYCVFVLYIFVLKEGGKSISFFYSFLLSHYSVFTNHYFIFMFIIYTYEDYILCVYIYLCIFYIGILVCILIYLFIYLSVLFFILLSYLWKEKEVGKGGGKKKEILPFLLHSFSFSLPIELTHLIDGISKKKKRKKKKHCYLKNPLQ